MDINISSQIVVQTAAQWAVDATVYSEKRILVTSDAFYGNSDQRKFKLADGTQTWAQLDYFASQLDAIIVKDNDGSGAIASFLNNSDVEQMSVTDTSVSFNPNNDGNSDFGGSVSFNGLSINALTGTTNNLDVGNNVIVTLTSTGAQSLTGIVGGSQKILCVYNADTADAITLVNSSASSTASNRFDFYPAEDFVLQPKQMVFLMNINAKWRVVGNQLASSTKTGLLSSTDWSTFNNKQGTITLTTTGTSGAATLVGTTLNIPQYSGGASGITIASTTITSGIDTRILYNNAGVVGEYTLTGTGTVVAMGTSPTFVTDITTPKVIGSVSSGGGLTLTSTSHATKGLINFGTSGINVYDEVNNRIGLGLSAPLYPLHIRTTGSTFLRADYDSTRYALFAITNAGALYITPYSGGGYANFTNISGGDSATSKIIFQGTQKASGVTTTSNAHEFYVGNNAATLAMALRHDGILSIGTTVVSARVNILSTTEQVRTLYDASNYFSTTVSSAGAVTFDAVGASASFTFSDNIKLTQTVTTEAVVSDTTVSIVINGTTYKLLAKA